MIYIGSLFVTCHQSKQMIAESKTCLSCGHHLHGRADKKFCNDYCRNAHHNQLNSAGNNYIRNINQSLRRNSRILESLLQPARRITKISRQVLQQKGFSFHYYTHMRSNRKGKDYYFCYEYGYRMLEKEQVMIVRRKNE